MKSTTCFGKKTRSKRISGQELDQYLSEVIGQDSKGTLAPSTSFEDAREALHILIAQCGSPKVRNMHRAKIEGFMIMQEMKVKKLEELAENWGWNKSYDHIEALAKFWDEG